MILADKIIENRKRMGWSQEELAEKLDVSRQSVSKWESAQSVPDMKKLLQLSEIFGVSTDYLLKDEIESEVPYEEEYYSDDDQEVRSVSMEEANAFLKFNEKAASYISFGVMLCILSPVALLLMIGLSQSNSVQISEVMATSLGIAVLLLMVAFAVAIFVMMGIRYNQYDYLENCRIETLYGVRGYVKELKSDYAETHSRRLIIGIILCIIAAIPLIMTQIASHSDNNAMIIMLGVATLLIMCAIGVKLIVHTCMIQEGFEKLLETGDYTRANKKVSGFDGVYWAIITAIYLGWSFFTFRWEMTWLIWPVAGVLFTAYREIIKAFTRER